MCTKYLTKDMQTYCGQINDFSCNFKCGSGCNHCSYADTYNTDNLTEKELNNMKIKEISKLIVIGLIKEFYVGRKLNEISFTIVRSKRSYCVVGDVQGLTVHVCFNDDNIIDDIFLDI